VAGNFTNKTAALNVLIVGTQYVGKLMNEEFTFPIEVRRSMSAFMGRAQGLEALYDLCGVEHFVKSRFPEGPQSMLDYSSGSGIEAALLANEVHTHRLTLTTLIGEWDEIEHNVSRLPGVRIVNIVSSEPPKIDDDLFDLITINDVLTEVPDNKITSLMSRLARLCTEKGVIVVMLTDGVAGMVNRLQDQFEIIARENPSLFDRMVFIVQHKSDHVTSAKAVDGKEILSHHDGDLGDQILSQNDISHQIRI
jgi:hypothetical protein